MTHFEPSDTARLASLLNALQQLNLLREHVGEFNGIFKATVQAVGTGIFGGEVMDLSTFEIDELRERIIAAIGAVSPGASQETGQVIDHDVPCAKCGNQVGIQSRGRNTVLRVICPHCKKHE
jgi:hypothetical protein